ncbi:class I SAM-dependent methyltransferase [Bacillaceae bacterium S4-13-56]
MTFDWHREAEKQWDGRASFWNKNSKSMWDEGSRKTIIPKFENHVPKGAKVADLGCGDGYGSYLLHNRGYKVIGLDLSKEMIDKANERLEDQTLHFIQGDITSLPFESESFNAVLCVNAMEWVRHPIEALMEMKRIVKPGGKLLIGILGPTAKPRENSYPRLNGEKVICNTMMPWEFRQLALENGLNVIDGHGVYKREVRDQHINGLPEELKQALTFMWVFVLEKE